MKRSLQATFVLIARAIATSMWRATTNHVVSRVQKLRYCLAHAPRDCAASIRATLRTSIRSSFRALFSDAKLEQRCMLGIFAVFCAGGFLVQTKSTIALLFAAGWVAGASPNVSALWLCATLYAIGAGLRGLGTFEPDRDGRYLAGAVVASTVATQILFGNVNEYRPRWAVRASLRTSHLGTFVLLLGVSYVCLSSIFDPKFQTGPLTLDPSRFERLRVTSKSSGVRIGIALSGGGYRAALMHAGVLHACERLGVTFTHASSVSGGSIIGAYYAAGGDPKEFPNAVASGDFQLKRAVMHVSSILRWKHRTDLQAQRLDDLIFRGMSLDQLGNRPGPKLLICTTNLCDGSAIGWASSFALVRSPLLPNEKHHVRYPPVQPTVTSGPCCPYAGDSAHELKVAQLVTASGAFPLAFNPVQVDLSYNGFEPEQKASVLLADGGISDNTGIDLLEEAHRESTGAVPVRMDEHLNEWPGMVDDWQLDLIIASDAGAFFEDQQSVGTAGGMTRWIDIVYRNVKSRDVFPRIRMPNVILLSPELEYRELVQQVRSPRPLRAGGPAPVRSAKDMPPDGLRAIIDSLPDEGIEGHAYQDVPTSDTKSEGQQLLSTATDKSRPREQREQAWKDLNKFLAWDRERCLTEFMGSSTLTDKYPTQQALRVFRLGIYLVVDNWPVLEGHIEDLREQRERCEKWWKRLCTAAWEIAGGKLELPSFSPEYAPSKLFRKLPPDEGQPFKLGDALQYVQDKDTEKRARLADADAARVGMLAHRLAHAVYHQAGHLTRFDQNRSLIDEFVADISYFSDDDEKEIDQITAEILRKAGAPVDGPAIMVERLQAVYGATGAGLEATNRLARLRRLAAGSATRPATTHPVQN